MKWDATHFHKKRFQSFGKESKAADLVAFDETGKQLWLIECKDFRPNGRTKTTDLCDEIAEKFKSTLAALVCARNTDDSATQRFARMALKKLHLRCAVHWEHPLQPHRLWPSVNMNRAAIRDKLRQRLYVADPSAELGNSSQLATVMPCTIRNSRNP
ncbi:hypothetical protein [Candidatus Symbiobacter mobilis]|uniref:hypothetical protein n=1 Tax=Candidatus Symbiobacter mobilis TaxID=1436290 RepID=UPI001246A969|nr:hypothetical protein [Candidatus Symbiobacter mobilis]